jgi:hypothetical protein
MDSSWTDSGLTFTDTEGGSTRTFHVYAKTFAAFYWQARPATPMSCSPIV